MELGIRAIINDKPDKIGAKIRQAEIEKINVMLILGEKEEKRQPCFYTKKI